MKNGIILGLVVYIIFSGYQLNNFKKENKELQEKIKNGALLILTQQTTLEKYFNNYKECLDVNNICIKTLDNYKNRKDICKE